MGVRLLKDLPFRVLWLNHLTPSLRLSLFRHLSRPFIVKTSFTSLLFSTDRHPLFCIHVSLTSSPSDLSKT